MKKSKNVLAENMRRFGTKNLNEQALSLKRISAKKLSSNEREDVFLVNGKYKVDVYRFTEDDGDSGTTAYYQDLDIMDDEESTAEFDGISNYEVYEAILDFYGNKNI
jgi:hypothetical protein